jgi:Polyketide cyclase / dehydrase and lipid transport
MRTWRSRATVRATPERVIETLTDADACARWSPVPFRLEDLDGTRLRPGINTRVSGRLLGVQARFQLEVIAASPARLLLVARGPIDIHVDYALTPAPAGCAVAAVVSVSPVDARFGRLLAHATGALLGSGTLEHALGRMAREAERAPRAGARHAHLTAATRVAPARGA